jgi:hypothetical protein
VSLLTEDGGNLGHRFDAIVGSSYRNLVTYSRYHFLENLLPRSFLFNLLFFSLNLLASSSHSPTVFL